jgi:lipopolysaccharide transport system ATP-binding protein
MPSKPAISVKNLNKCYQLYAQPIDRLKQFLWRGRRQYFREFWALRDVSFDIAKGEVLGIIGRNGAGKSTLLQLLCGTLNPTDGSVNVQGRIAALLELGSGFNPEFTGRENVYLSASILGLSQQEIDERFEAIVDFSGIRDFIDQPVKTYSSGMYVRLAFSVATSVDPDILIVDEALSVGDGEFARKSFDRIRAMKEAGKTILFCSHTLYQVEAFCDRVLWLDRGRLMNLGDPQDVVQCYSNILQDNTEPEDTSSTVSPSDFKSTIVTPAPEGHARLNGIKVIVDGKEFSNLEVMSSMSDVSITVSFISDPNLPCPSIAAGFMFPDSRVVASASTHFDKIMVNRTENGCGKVDLVFPKLSLLKGNYWVAAYLLCENGIHVYDCVNFVTEIKVRQANLEQGIVSLPHFWKC